jgi:hypothetical protein
MLSRGFALAGILLLAAVSFAAPAKDGEGAFRYRFKEGEKLKYVLTEKGAMSIAGMEFESKSVFDLTWQVTKVGKDGKVTITQTIDRVRMDIDGAVKISYDSKAAKDPDDPVSKQIAEGLKIYVGASMILTVDGRGQIASLKFSEKLADAISKLPPAAAGISQALSEDSTRRLIGQCMPVLPEKAPVKGRPWESKFKAKFAGVVNFTLNNKFTYEGDEKRAGRTVAKIVNKPTLAVDTDPGEGKIDLKSQEVGSTSYFDRAAGQLLEATYSQKVEMEITEKGMTLTIKGKVETTLKQADEKK